MDNNKRKQLQALMQNDGWEILEEYVKEYLKKHEQPTIRRATQFDTIWEQAYLEGGTYHLKNFFTQAFNEAKLYDQQPPKI